MQELKKKKDEDAKLMPPPSLPGMEAPDDRTPNQKKKDQKLLSKIIKPKGWNKNWSKGEQSNQVGIPGPYGRLRKVDEYVLKWTVQIDFDAGPSTMLTDHFETET